MSHPTKTRQTKIMTGIVLAPALIAGVGAGLLSRMMTHWYEEQNLKLETLNLKPNKE